jgi:hypothetical protein
VDDNATSDAINLRGGMLNALEMNSLRSDAELEPSQPRTAQANRQSTASSRADMLDHGSLPKYSDKNAKTMAQRSLRLHGRQGCINIAHKWADFVQGVVFLLSLQTAQQEDPDRAISIAVDSFEYGPRGETVIYTQEGLLYLDHTKYDKLQNDKILTFVVNKFHDTNDKPIPPSRRCFVRSSHDTRPQNLRPDEPLTGLIEVWREGDPGHPRAYMRASTEASACSCTGQYASEFHRAVRVLLPTAQRHYFMRLALQNGSDSAEECGSIYVGQDPPQSFVDLLPKYLEARGLVRLKIAFEPAEAHLIPILTTPRNEESDESSGLAGTISKDQLGDINAIASLVVNYIVQERHEKLGIKYVELYLTAQGFVHDSVQPVFCYFENGLAMSTSHQWNERIRQLKAEKNGTIYEHGFAIWGRPVFKEYVLINKSGSAAATTHTLRNLLGLDLKTFKQTISTFLLPQKYDELDRNHVLLVSIGQSHEIYEYVVRFDTTESEWYQIKKRIAYPMLLVSMIGEELKYDMEEATRWGESCRRSSVEIPADEARC